MTLDVEPARIAPRARKISRKKVIILALAAFALVAVGYLARYGQCETQSKFCTLGVVGTRSDIGFEWDSVSLYITTYPDGVTVVGTWPW